jgi:hypothetical protein
MQSMELIMQLEKIYELLNQDELNRKRSQEQEGNLYSDFEEKQKQIYNKYDEERQPYTDIFENKQKELQEKLKSHQVSIFKKPINIALIVISVSMMFVTGNELLKIAALIFTMLFITKDFFIDRRNIPVLEQELKDLMEEYKAYIDKIDKEQLSDLNAINSQFEQNKNELLLNNKEEDIIKEQLKTNNLVGGYFKNKEKIRTFISLLSEGRAKNIDECIRISELDDRELITKQKEQDLLDKEHHITTFNQNLQQKEQFLLETERVLEVREKTLNFNRSLLEHLSRNISSVEMYLIT